MTADLVSGEGLPLVLQLHAFLLCFLCIQIEAVLKLSLLLRALILS